MPHHGGLWKRLGPTTLPPIHYRRIQNSRSNEITQFVGLGCTKWKRWGSFNYYGVRWSQDYTRYSYFSRAMIRAILALACIFSVSCAELYYGTGTVQPTIINRVYSLPVTQFRPSYQFAVPYQYYTRPYIAPPIYYYSPRPIYNNHHCR